MSDTNEKVGGRRLAVYAIPEPREDGRKAFWPKLGVAYVNRDGSINIYLEALPLGTNQLQVRELKDEARNGAGASGGGPARRNGLEAVEVRP